MFRPVIPDAERDSRDEVEKKTLMLLVIAGKKTTDGIEFLVLTFNESTEVLVRTFLLGEVIHVGMDFCHKVGFRSKYFNKMTIMIIIESISLTQGDNRSFSSSIGNVFS